MSDGYPFTDLPSACTASATGHEAATSPYTPRSVAPRRRERGRFDIAELARWLPRIGTVLWLERRPPLLQVPQHVGSDPRPLLLEHAASALLARSTALHAQSAITPHGPREWLSAHAGDGALAAKLFLLPDSDCLAWDQMGAALGLEPVDASQRERPSHHGFVQRALARFGQRWQARLLAFELSSMPWLQVLGAHPPLRISLLGLDLAREIVRDENAEWGSPLHSG